MNTPKNYIEFRTASMGMYRISLPDNTQSSLWIDAAVQAICFLSLSESDGQQRIMVEQIAARLNEEARTMECDDAA